MTGERLKATTLTLPHYISTTKNIRATISTQLRSIFVTIFCVFTLFCAYANPAYAEKPVKKPSIKVPKTDSDGLVLSSKRLENTDWTIKLPRKNQVIRFQATLSSPTNKHDIPEFNVNLANRPGRKSAQLSIYDKVCKGEYDLSLAFSDQNKDRTFTHRKNIAQWPETIDIEIKFIERRKGLNHFLASINGQENKIATDEKIRYLNFEIDNGYVDIENFYLLSRAQVKATLNKLNHNANSNNKDLK